MRGIAYTEYEPSTYRSSISTTDAPGQPKQTGPANTRYTVRPDPTRASAIKLLDPRISYVPTHFAGDITFRPQTARRPGQARARSRPARARGGRGKRPVSPANLAARIARNVTHARGLCSPASATECRPGPWLGRIPRARGTHDMLAVFY